MLKSAETSAAGEVSCAVCSLFVFFVVKEDLKRG